MPTPIFPEPLNPEAKRPSVDVSMSRPDIPALNELAVRSLASLFVERESLFSRSLWMANGRLEREGTSRKRTIIALLGLQRLEESGENAPFDVASIRDVVLADTNWVRNIGDLGLLTWLIAECEPERLRNLLNEFHFATALEKYASRRPNTRDVAWFLSGIAHMRLAAIEALPDLTDVALDTYHLLQGSQSESGIFGHTAHPDLLGRFLSGRFGTFSDQVHAIYSLTTFARAFHLEEPLQAALTCANSVRALQGELGQWWFLYDKYSCRVLNHYPVVSFHQDGIAPVGLQALGEATGQSFRECILKGLSWITGANELGDDLRSQDRGMIWDSIGPSEHTPSYREALCNFLRIYRAPRAQSLKIRYEARPDHFGWLLYAFGRSGLPQSMTNATASAS